MLIYIIIFIIKINTLLWHFIEQQEYYYTFEMRSLYVYTLTEPYLGRGAQFAKYMIFSPVFIVENHITVAASRGLFLN